MGELPTHDRAYLLSESKRNDVLSLREVRRYGLDSFGDADYVSIYGLKPGDWYARGIRVLARTAVECTRDRLADLIGRDVAAVARTAPAVSGSVVVDPFAGSCNTLHWIKRRTRADRALGFELDEAVFEATRRNLSLAALDVVLSQEDYETGLSALRVLDDQLLIVYVAPPWGDALSEASGLDLRRTTPPVVEIVDDVATSFRGHKILFAIQIHERVVSASVAEVASRSRWSGLRTYDIDPPGRNHGVLLGTVGWSA